jgi:nitroreductase
MQLDESIKTRRSVRTYTDEPVSKEHLDAVLEAGVWAPTAMHREPLKFIIIENKELIKYVSDETKLAVKQFMPPLAERFSTPEDIICYNAPMLVLVCVEKNPQFSNIDFIDCVLGAENIFLKAHELGLGTCYMGFVNQLNNKPEVLKKIGVPDNCQMMVPFIMGHPKKGKPTVNKRKKPNIIKWVK